MLLLAIRNLFRRPLRSALTLVGLAMAVAVLACLAAFGHGYQRALSAELDRMGLQLMLVPLGCPYDAAARVLKGKALEFSLPESAIAAARGDPAVAVAAPLLMAALPHQDGRTDLWVGLDEAALVLKPWWRVQAGQKWFASDDSTILGCDAAEVEMRSPGDFFFSPETGRKLRVTGVLERSGTSDDSLFFVPLRTAQQMFGYSNRITAIAIRLRDPALLSQASARLQAIPGAQVVTLTEMMGTFLNLLGAVRTLLLSLAVVAVAVSTLGVFNTSLAAVVERAPELAILRAIGASRWHITGIMMLETCLLAVVGSSAGIVIAAGLGPLAEVALKHWVPLAPSESLVSFGTTMVLQCLAVGLTAGLAAGLYPAWRASRLEPATALKTE